MGRLLEGGELEELQSYLKEKSYVMPTRADLVKEYPKSILYNLSFKRTSFLDGQALKCIIDFAISHNYYINNVGYSDSLGIIVSILELKDI